MAKDITKIRVCAGTYAESCEVVAKAKLKELKEAGFEESKLVYEEKMVRVIIGEFTTSEEADAAIKKLKEKKISVYAIIS